MILVTGATGFIGSEIVRRASRRGWQVRGLSRHPERHEALRALPHVELVEGDVADPGSLEGPMEGVGAVIHLVGIIAETKWQSFEEAHVDGTENVLDAARREGVGRFVHMSALGAEEGRGATEYFRTKWEAEEAVRGSGLDHVIFRPSIVFGPGEDFTGKLAPLIRFSPVLALPGGGAQRLQPVWVGDVADCFLQAARAERLSSDLHQVAGPEVMTLARMTRILARAMGKRPRPVVPLPVSVARLGAAAIEALPVPPLLTRAQLTMLELESVADPGAVVALLEEFEIEHASLAEKAPEWLGKERR